MGRVRLRRERIDESARPDWEPDFNPRELRLLRRALGDLRFVSGPIAGRAETRSGRLVDAPEPDKLRERHRLFLRKVLRQIEEISSDITVAIHENRFELSAWESPARRSCPGCQSRNRGSARFCDHCGERLSGVA